MSPFAAILGGGGGGLAGAMAAHLILTTANRFTGIEGWLKGPYGPPFFNIAFFMGLLYGCIGLGLGRRPKSFLIGFLGIFLGIALPMALLSHTAAWGLSEAAPTKAWVYAVLIIFILATWGTIAGLGYALGAWRGAAGAVSGAFMGYVLLQILMTVAPALRQNLWSAQSLLPAPTVLLDGLLTGLGMGLGISLSHRIGRNNEKANPS